MSEVFTKPVLIIWYLKPKESYFHSSCVIVDDLKLKKQLLYYENGRRMLLRYKVILPMFLTLRNIRRWSKMPECIMMLVKK